MIVRFDPKAVQQAVAKESEPIGVEGDPATKGGLSEAEAIVQESKRALEESGEKVERVSSGELKELEGQQDGAVQADPGPELNAEALEKAKLERGGGVS